MYKCCCPSFLELPLHGGTGFILVSPYLVLDDIRALNLRRKIRQLGEKGKHNMKEHHLPMTATEVNG